MIKKYGYACINMSLKPKSFQTCRLKSVFQYEINYLRKKILNNLDLTKDILIWNIENGIYMYRATSQLLPLVTHPDILSAFEWRWYLDEEILGKMEEIKSIIEKNQIRLSMHPDQFTVLNSDKKHVVENTIEYINYHYQILDKLGGKDMILHVGGVYGNKNIAVQRFISNFMKLDEKCKSMIRLENDDKSYNIEDVLYINQKTNIPIVFDIHHHNCNFIDTIDVNKIKAVVDTWKDTGMVAKMHISSGKTSSTDRKHSDYIRKDDFMFFKELTEYVEIDLMVEAKLKEKAVLELLKYNI